MQSTGLEPTHTPKNGQTTVIKYREVGQLRYSWQWAREARFVWRARKRFVLAAKTSFQLASICKLGACLARMAEQIEEARQELEDIDCGPERDLGRLERCKGWNTEMGMLYRRAWTGQVPTGEAALDAIQISNTAGVHAELEMQHDAERMKLASQMLKAPAAIERDEQPAAGDTYDYDAELDPAAPTIRVGRPIRVTKD